MRSCMLSAPNENDLRLSHLYELAYFLNQTALMLSDTCGRLGNARPVAR
jgi:hypothetical protein